MSPTFPVFWNKNIKKARDTSARLPPTPPPFLEFPLNWCTKLEESYLIFFSFNLKIFNKSYRLTLSLFPILIIIKCSNYISFRKSISSLFLIFPFFFIKGHHNYIVILKHVEWCFHAWKYFFFFEEQKLFLLTCFRRMYKKIFTSSHLATRTLLFFVSLHAQIILTAKTNSFLSVIILKYWLCFMFFFFFHPLNNLYHG